MLEQTAQNRSEEDDRIIDLGSFAPYLVHNLDRHFQRVLADALAEFRLTVPEWRTLVAVERFDMVTLDDIVRTIKLPQSTVSRTVQKLQERRLLRKSWNDQDARVAQIRISKAGERRLREATQAALRVCNAEVERIIGDDASQWFATMRKILRRLGPDKYLDLDERFHDQKT